LSTAADKYASVYPQNIKRYSCRNKDDMMSS
jgi:hypothetical protein